MSIVSIGTPTKYQNTGTGTNLAIPATWGTGQTPTGSGDLLVALVTASGSTSAGTITEQTTYGWTKIYEGGGTLVKAAIFTKAAGVSTELAPTFQSSISGTSARCHRSVTLYQLHDNVNGYLPVLDTGNQASGTSSLTLATAAAVAGAGEYALATIAQQYSSSASNTWGAVTGWTQNQTDAATAYYHYVDAINGAPASGSTLSYNPTHSTSTGIGGSIAVFKPGILVASFSGGVKLKHMIPAGSGEGISVASTGGTGATPATYDTVGPSAAGVASNGSRSLNWTHPAGADHRAVLVGVSCDASSDAGWTVTATCAGNPMTPLGVSHAANQGQGIIAMFGIADQGPGTLAIAVSVAGGNIPGDMEGGSIAFAGADTVSPFGAPQTAYGNSETGSVAVTAASTSMIGAFAAVGNTIVSTNAPATSRFVNNYKAGAGSATGNAAGSTAVGTGSSVTMGWTLDTSLGGPSWAVAAVEVKGTITTSTDIRQKKMQVSGTLETVVSGVKTASGDIRQKKMKIAGTGSSEISAVSVIAGLGGGSRGSFVDQNSIPVFYMGDVPWGLPANAGRWSSGNWQGEIDAYLNSRQTQKINVVRVAIFGINKIASSYPGADDYPQGNTGKMYDGTDPFIGGNPGVFNDTFWNRIDYLVDQANARGIAIELTATFKWNALAGCFAENWTVQNATDFGTALGNRYKNRTGVIWFFGDDYYQDDDARYTAILTAMRAAGDNHPVWIENYSTGTTSLHDLSASPTGAPFGWGHTNAQANLLYYYYPWYYSVEFGYQETNDPLPIIQGDGTYFGDCGDSSPWTNDRRLTRNQVWWAIASGARGVSVGSVAIQGWGAASSITAVNAEVWGASMAGAIRTYIESLTGWNTLLPDLTSSLVTSGRGTRQGYSDQYWLGGNSSNYVAASVNPEKTLAIIYCSGTFSITIDETKIGAGYTATKVDPANCATTSLTTGTSYNSAGWGTNSQGGSDWVLVLEAPPSGAVAEFSGSVKLKKMSIAGSGTGISVASGAPKLKKMGVAASGAGISVATADLKQKKMTVAATGTAISAGAGAVKLKKMGVSGSGSMVMPAMEISGGVSLKKMTPAGTGAGISVVSGGPRLKKMGIAGTGTASSDGTSATSLKKMRVAGQGTKVSTGIGAVSLKKMKPAGTLGNISVVTAAIVFKKMGVAGSGTAISAGTAAVKMKKMQVQADSAPLAAFAGGVKLKKFRLAGTGIEISDISGGPSLKKMRVSAVGTGISAITGVVSMKKLRTAGAGTAISVITVGVSMKKMSAAGTGTGISVITGVVGMKKLQVQAETEPPVSSPMFVMSML